MITNQIAWEIPAHEGYAYMKELKKKVDKKQINVISVDPIANDTQRYYNGPHIRVKPNTDVALMMGGMAYYLYDEKLYDEKFIKKYTVGFNRFKKNIYLVKLMV